ncbi:copine-9 isoform X3 [Physeter macrocephalus]|uniref:Copine-9 isoform X3 n=1 Tax=Physeter macrocephalus TaxID=9755 RepID=A0A9W2WKD6_PHYMC|nr:copine-9 isoform X3 [Physeter catodon]
MLVPLSSQVQRRLQNQHLQTGFPGTSVPGPGRGDRRPGQPSRATPHDIATMQLCANKLDKKDFFGKSDPFLVFYRSNEDGTFTICHKTEVVKNTLNPVWQPFSIPVRVLCNGDYDRTVKIDVYDWDRDGSHDFIGEFTTSYRELSKAQNQFTVYEVLNPRKKCKKKKYVNSGTVTLLSFSVDSEFTFVDYIKGGTQLNFTVAIDFTASNGNPLQPTSLHYMSPYQLSAYAMALKAVGEIIQDYDSDKLFPAYGFGAKLPPEGRISHQFPLNNNDEDPNCAGIEGVLESYFQSLRTVQLYGPTYFAPVINQVARPPHCPCLSLLSVWDQPCLRQWKSWMVMTCACPLGDAMQSGTSFSSSHSETMSTGQGTRC